MKLNSLLIFPCLAAVIAMTGTAYADAIPYPNPGTTPPTVPLSATATGNIMGYFHSFSASDTDFIYMVDITSGYTSPQYFQNNATAIGSSADFGPVTTGDQLAFVLYNQTTDQYFSTDPTRSTDGKNHGYVTSFSGSGGIPAGTYIGMEDLYIPPSDQDYNDDTFVFTNVSAAIPTPEPSSIILLGSGLLGVAGLVRRRMGV